MAEYEVAEINPYTGQPTTHLVKTACVGCGSFLVAAPAYAHEARCSPCLVAWIEDPQRVPVVPDLAAELAALSGTGGCCGTASLLRCQLCPSSPTYWRNQ